MPTKTVRIDIEDAEKIIQAAREIAYKGECEVSPSEVIKRLINSCLKEVKEEMIYEKKGSV